jgi:hypothetical protein
LACGATQKANKRKHNRALYAEGLTVPTTKLRASRATAPDNLQPPVFVVGMSRGVTSWLSRCLSQHPDAFVFVESSYWGRAFVSPADGVMLSPREIELVLRSLRKARVMLRTRPLPGSYTKLPEQLNGALHSIRREPMSPGQLYMRIMRCIADQEGASCIIEKTPHHINWVDRIVKHLPDARFIVMIREPYGLYAFL